MAELRKKLIVAVKLVLALVCLYFFICSLSFLATSFRLISGRQSGKIFANADLLQNPIVGVMLGVLSTVLVQSSSTTTSIVIGMVGADILGVRQAIPMIMGANIGTSVTNTIVSITQIGDRDEFSLAFACAVVHDIFNWLTVITLLVVEVVTGFLYHTTSAIVAGMESSNGTDFKTPDLLKALTKPFTKLVVQIDKKVLKGWSLNDTDYINVTTLFKKNCKHHVDHALSSPVGSGLALNETPLASEKFACGYLFAGWSHADVWAGVLLLVISLAILAGCLVGLVKILNSLMKNQMAGIVKKSLNSSIPCAPWLTGYVAIFIGFVVTFLVQSSSVFTSTLTPLVGTGLIELRRAYPLTLGSNIGTTTTGLLAALAADGEKLKDSLQIALCHTLFNIVGIALFYPIPLMRWPIPMAKIMGRTVAQYRWFAIFYLIFMFFLLPLYIFGLSLIGPIAIYIGFIPPFALLVLVVIINIVQDKKPKWLPVQLRDWDFLPLFMRSLEPYDWLISKMTCCGRRGGMDVEKSEMQAI